MNEPALIRTIDRIVNSFASIKPLMAAQQSATTKARWDFLAEPDMTTSFKVLRDVANMSQGNHTPARRALAGLLISQGSRDEDVDIRRITAIGASKGRYVGNLPRLLTTISEPPKWVADMSREEQLAKVQDEVWSDFGNKVDNRFTVVEEGWSGLLIGMNTGTARRFSMLHCACHSGPLLFPARIERINFEPDFLKELTALQWVVMLPEDAGRQFVKAAEAAKIEGVEEISLVKNHGCPDDDEQVKWAVLACPTSTPRYKAFRLAVEDASVPRFDFSHWLRLLSKGRMCP